MKESFNLQLKLERELLGGNVERNRGESHYFEPVAKELDEPGQSSEPLVDEPENLQGVAINHDPRRHTLEEKLDDEAVGVLCDFIGILDLAVEVVVCAGALKELVGEDALLVERFPVADEDDGDFLVQLQIAKAKNVNQKEAENVVADETLGVLDFDHDLLEVLHESLSILGGHLQSDSLEGDEDVLEKLEGVESRDRKAVDQVEGIEHELFSRLEIDQLFGQLFELPVPETQLLQLGLVALSRLLAPILAQRRLLHETGQISVVFFLDVRIEGRVAHVVFSAFADVFFSSLGLRLGQRRAFLFHAFNNYYRLFPIKFNKLFFHSRLQEVAHTHRRQSEHPVPQVVARKPRPEARPPLVAYYFRHMSHVFAVVRLVSVQLGLLVDVLESRLQVVYR